MAVNANTGDVVWEVPLGLSEALPESKRLTGNSGSAGPSLTAGGLVFVGATSDRRLRAFDAKTGKELWSFRLAGQVNANPMIYRGKGGQAIRRRRGDRHARRLLAALALLLHLDEPRSAQETTAFVFLFVLPRFDKNSVDPRVHRTYGEPIESAVTLVDAMLSGRCRGV